MGELIFLESKDAERITRLNRELHDHHAKMYPRVFKPWNYDALLPAFEALLARSDVSCYILLADGEEAGYLLGWPQFREENGFQYARRAWYIDHICVLEKFRGRGLSKILLNKAKEIAKDEACTVLEIHHWTGNVLAERSFEGAGFVPFNRKLELHLD